MCYESIRRTPRRYRCYKFVTITTIILKCVEHDVNAEEKNKIANRKKINKKNKVWVYPISGVYAVYAAH